MIARCLLSVVLATALSARAAAQAAPAPAAAPRPVGAVPTGAETIAQKVDKIFAQCDKPDSPGCALAVIRDAQVIYTRGYGMADLEHDIAISPGSVFYIGSTAKQFTAMTIALLAQQGKLSLDDDIRKYLPELPDYGAPIAICHLVHHTSGLRDYWTLVELAGRRSEDVYAIADIIELAARQKELNFPSGTDYLYSNTGYTLLAAIVQRATGKSMREFAEEHIFKPLGMNHTRFNDDHTAILKHRAYGYSPRRGNGFRLNIVNNDLIGAGGLWTTVEDMLLWDQNFYSAKVGGSALLAQAQTPGTLASGEKLNYAFGLTVGEYKGLKMISHAGAFAGYRAEYIRFPEQRFSVVVLCNLSAMNPSARAREVADVYLAEHFKDAKPASERPRESTPLSEQELQSKVGIYAERATGDILRVFVKDGALTAGVGAGLVLVPVSKERFRTANAPVEVIFETPASGGTRRFRWVSEGGRTRTFESVPPANPTPEQLAGYAGTYYSEELEATYRIVLQEGKLVVKRSRADEVALEPASADVFTASPGLAFRFRRDGQSRVAGLQLNAGRVRHLRFVKTSGE